MGTPDRRPHPTQWLSQGPNSWPLRACHPVCACVADKSQCVRVNAKLRICAAPVCVCVCARARACVACVRVCVCMCVRMCVCLRVYLQVRRADVRKP